LERFVVVTTTIGWGWGFIVGRGGGGFVLANVVVEERYLVASGGTELIVLVVYAYGWFGVFGAAGYFYANGFTGSEEIAVLKVHFSLPCSSVKTTSNPVFQTPRGTLLRNNL
jgi:hypothetical protein